MNAAKVAASMVLADRPRQALSSMKVTIIGRCRSNNEWLTLVSFCSLAASNLGQGSCIPTEVEVLYHRTVTSREVQNQCGLAYPINNGNLLHTYLHALGFCIKRGEEQLAAPLASLTGI